MAMEKLTKARIEEMANKVAQYCYDHHYGDVIMYYNGKRRFVDYYGHERDEIQEDIIPQDYVKYAAYNHIFTMTSEGGLDLEDEVLEGVGVEKIFDEYGLYSELGYGYDCTCYTYTDMEVEYTTYERPKESVRIIKSHISSYDDKIKGLIIKYNELIAQYGERHDGACIIGDGFKFELDEQPYFFSTNYYQSEAPRQVIDGCRKYLEEISAENIYYDCGILN